MWGMLKQLHEEMKVCNLVCKDSHLQQHMLSEKVTQYKWCCLSNNWLASIQQMELEWGIVMTWLVLVE